MTRGEYLLFIEAEIMKYCWKDSSIVRFKFNFIVFSSESMISNDWFDNFLPFKIVCSFIYFDIPMLHRFKKILLATAFTPFISTAICLCLHSGNLYFIHCSTKYHSPSVSIRAAITLSFHVYIYLQLKEILYYWEFHHQSTICTYNISSYMTCSIVVSCMWW